MRSFQFIVLTPPCLLEPSIAIAASRAGGIGILDLEYVKNEQIGFDAISKLSQYAKKSCGVKLYGGDIDFVTRVVSSLPNQFDVVILACGNPGILHKQIQLLKSRNITVLLEVTSLDQILLWNAEKIDGFVARGNEAGGRVGDETSFILLQQLLKNTSLPIWAQGGIGLHTVSACYVAGAAGVVLDVQLALTRESALPEVVKAVIGRMDGGESTCVGGEMGGAFRVYARSGLPILRELCEVADVLASDPRPRSEILPVWHQAVKDRAGWGAPEQHVWFLGQDAAFAASLARRFYTVGGVLDGFRQAIASHVRTAKVLRPLDEGSPLARSHGTRYPIVQGPMARISDVPAFAARVAENGALPFLALAMLRARGVKDLLEETKKLLGDRPWGVGVLGFVSHDIFQEQVDVIRVYKPPFVLIAGGRPDQANAFEREGIHAYLHVPSPGLLRMFVENGVRRFIFEGRECGGHVGPRSSFILWNTAIEILTGLLQKREITDCQVLFAGGIHDALSASMVAAMAAPLAELGVQIGVLLGTAYLFTEEALATGAIVKGFQNEAIRCTRTALMESGPGHATRCADTPYTKVFVQEKSRLTTEGRSVDEIRYALEDLNLGRLRIASKGVIRNPRYGRDPAAPKYIVLSNEEQHNQGMYMIGQLAALRDRTCTIDDLHHDVSIKGSERLGRLGEFELTQIPIHRKELPSDVAIIGMSCILPKAGNLRIYWENILDKVDTITEIPADRWDWRLYFDSDPNARDKVYSKWGGFIDPVPFNPTQYGMPPNTLSSIEPLQLLTLEVVQKALEDAGYADRPFPRERTSVIFGSSGGISELGQQYAFRSCLPMFMRNVSPDVLSKLPEWTEDSFAGILLNVAAGRVSNRFDFGGVNYTVDAACASSLAAVYLAVRELENGTSDMVIVGGTDTMQNPFSYLCFSKTHALSLHGRCRTFDENADGIVISEGFATLVLKRLSDAERDGDRIYAVIKAVSGSSDGRGKGLTAPRPEGQTLALERAYAKAGFSPATVGLVEAHGTGTVAGDRAEVETLKRVFEAAGASPQSCAIGSVKSMIGHTKSTAGVAGLIKVALSLYYKILPPTIGVEKPNSILTGSPFYVNTEMRPWIYRTADQPRRAGVSAFGFGGTNFHAVIEEYTGNFLPEATDIVPNHWPSELLLWRGRSRHELLDAVERLDQALSHGANPALRDLAFTLWKHCRDSSGLNLAMVVTSLADLRQKLTWAREALKKTENSYIHDPRGIYFAGGPIIKEGKVAFLFPGQGSQYPDMLRELAIVFPGVRDRFERADHILADRFPRLLSTYVFPPPRFNKDEEQTCQQMLTTTNIAQPALGVADMSLFHLLQTFGVKPDMVAGHSYGEYVALCAAGVFSEEVLYTLSEARGRFIAEMAGHQNLGIMAAVDGGREAVAEALQSVERVWIANVNAPRQTIISGTRPAVEEAIKRLEVQGMRARFISVACAFHSPMMAPARDRLAAFLSTIDVTAPRLDVFSNTSAALYPQHPKEIIALLSDHLVHPVKFANEIEAMYSSGARIFVEVGPRNVLTGLTQQILDGRSYLAVALDTPGRFGILQLHHALGQLAVHGVPLQLDSLYQRREVRHLKLDALIEETRGIPLPPTTFMVDGSRVRPLRESFDKKSQSESCMQKKAESEVVPQPAKSSDSIQKPTSPDESQISSSVIPLLPNGGDSDVMFQFQKLMNQFLETQQRVMLAYLKGSTDGQIPLSEVSSMIGRQPPQVATSLTSQSVGTSPLLFQETSSAKTVLPSSEASNVSATSTPSNQLEQVFVQERKPSFDKEKLRGQLLQIVSERTGYPPEMLDMDLNMEADLGIDSIKRVEILGALQRVYLSNYGQTQIGMEELTKIKTLRGIIDYISNAFQSQSETKADESYPDQQSLVSTQAVSGGNDDKVEVSRMLLTLVNVPLTNQKLQLTADSVFIITDDERGVAHALSNELKQLGGRIVLVRMGSKVDEVSSNLYTADLTNPTAVTDLLALVRRQHGLITGVIHLLPLKMGIPFEKMGLAEWRARLCLEVKSLFYLAKATAADLKRAAKLGGGWLVAATSMGGAFASDAKGSQVFFPGQGGIAGLIKTIALEWPSVWCKVVDLNPDASASTLSDYLLGEMAGGDKQVEIGYRDSRRLILCSRTVPLNQEGISRLSVDSNWVVLVTGGAKGITAGVACELAKRYQPTLLLVGRAPLPASHEPPGTAAFTSPQELKAALINLMRQSEQSVTPAQVEAAYYRLLQEREMRSNISAMQQAGAIVHYYQVDVCNERAFGDLIDEIYNTYGRLDGVIHGAGIIEDKLIEDKTSDSFDRVFDIKADSVFILSRKLRAATLKFLAFFSSVAGCFGNRGQGDYAAANGVMNKLAIYLDSQWPGRIVAINWGPWDEGGMVSVEVRKQFAARGVQAVPSSVGRRMLDEELRFGQKGEVEVIIGNGPWTTAGTVRTASPDVFPLLKGVPPRLESDGAVEFIRRVDPSFDLYLQDHKLDGKPVMPMTMAMEFMAEVVQKGWPGFEIMGIRSLLLLRGIVMDDSVKEIRIVARPQFNPSHDSLVREVPVEIYELDKPNHPCYRAIFQIGEHLPSPPPYDSGVLRELLPFPRTVEDIYRHWLFHGPRFQNISTIEGINQQGICAILLPSSPARCLGQDACGRWLLDPVLLDCGLQLAILWERVHYDMTPLPTGFKSYRRFDSPSDSPVRCYLRAYPSAGGHILFVDISFLDTDGRMITFMEGVEASCSKALNRLAGLTAPVRGNNE